MISPTRFGAALQRRVGPWYRRGTRGLNRSRLRRLAGGLSVQLGSGSNPFEGWLNVDVSAATQPDLVLDLRGGFPAPASSVRRVYSEHVFEHLELPDAQQVLHDLRLALEPSGVVRIAMPDLDAIIERYQGDWRDQEWLADRSYAHIDSPAHMLNFGLRSWGHKYIYSYDELALRLRLAGFTEIQRVAWGESSDPELRGRETRPDSLLIVEAR